MSDAVAPNTRRQRGKREATFLESIRDVLSRLSDEIADIKLTVKGSQAQQSVYQLTPPAVTYPQYWEEWNGVFPGGVEDAVLSYLNPLAPVFKPSIQPEMINHSAAKHHRDDLLKWRHSEGAFPKLDEFERTHKVVNDITDALCLWRPMSKNRFAVRGTKDYEELRAEAALRLQAYFRQRWCQESGDEEDKAEHGTVAKRSEVVNIVQLRKTLESRLEYMLKYLEMLKESKTQYSRDVFLNVLEEVKMVQAWQKAPLTAATLEVKIQELDTFMAAAVHRMLPGEDKEEEEARAEELGEEEEALYSSSEDISDDDEDDEEELTEDDEEEPKYRLVDSYDGLQVGMELGRGRVLEIYPGLDKFTVQIDTRDGGVEIRHHKISVAGPKMLATQQTNVNTT